MKAARFYESGQPFKIENVPDPVPGSGEVVVTVKAAGICGTDLHIAVEGSVPTAVQPITLGHEAAGVVSQVGEGVTAWQVGDRVCLMPHVPCGECYYCTRGEEALCPRTQILGIHFDGAFAEQIKISAAALIPLPESISFALGAILTDAVSTAYHAVVCRGNLQAGETVAVFGCGGLGHHGVMWARQQSAGRIIAVDVAPNALARAKAAGADETIDAREGSAAKRIKALTDRLGVDLALEFVGRAETVKEAMKSLRRNGRLVVVGVGPDRVTLPPLQVFVGLETALIGSMGFHRADLEKIIGLVASGEVNLSESVGQSLPLSNINDAFQLVAEQRSDAARVVITPEDMV
ncbi:MAG: alcohol dehydrogenase catalytic domain-containing protein [Chloroflexi bacterium]|nr:alcohol dehydrogenase catalytic domain-containing protein [Chloroflexota bacterium]